MSYSVRQTATALSLMPDVIRHLIRKGAIDARHLNSDAPLRAGAQIARASWLWGFSDRVPPLHQLADGFEQYVKGEPEDLHEYEYDPKEEEWWERCEKAERERQEREIQAIRSELAVLTPRERASRLACAREVMAAHEAACAEREKAAEAEFKDWMVRMGYQRQFAEWKARFFVDIGVECQIDDHGDLWIEDRNLTRWPPSGADGFDNKPLAWGERA